MIVHYSNARIRLGIFTSLLAIILSCNIASAQVQFNNLEELWQYADLHNATISNAQIELIKAQKSKDQALLDLLPDINASGSFTDNTTIQTTLIPAAIFGGPPDVYTPVQFGQKYIYNTGFTGQIDILNLQSWFNIRVQKATKELTKNNAANSKRVVYQQLAGQYYTCMLSKEALTLSQLSAAIADSVVSTVANRYQEGTVSAAALESAQINAERAKQTSITAYYQYQTSLNNIKALIGLQLRDSFVLKEQLKPEVRGVETTFKIDPTVSVAQSQIKLNAARLKQSNAGIYPIISLQYNNNSQQFDNQFRPFDAGGPKWYPANFWSIRASWALFNGGNRWLQSQKNKLTLQQSKNDAEQAVRQAAINDENLRLAYQKSIAMFDNAERILKLSLENYKHIDNRYKEGIATLDDKLRSFSDYIGYQNQYLNALSEMLVQLYNIKIRTQQF